MKIALDYDDTYTKDPEYWDQLIFIAEEYGHEIFVITNRQGISDEDDEVFNVPIDSSNVVFTGGKAKKEFAEDLGIKIDVWIDDEPEYILEDKVK